MNSWFLATVERVLERSARDSFSAQKRLEALEGRSFRIRVDGLGVDCLLVAEAGRLRVLSDGDRPADAMVRGTPLDLLRLVRERNVASRLHGSGVELTGRVHVAEQFAETLQLLLPDLEEELSRFIGDVPAHRAGHLVRGFAAWLGTTVQALGLDTGEYLTEEGRLLPTRYEVEAQFAAVERLRDDVERAEARLERIERVRRNARDDAFRGPTNAETR